MFDQESEKNGLDNLTHELHHYSTHLTQLWGLKDKKHINHPTEESRQQETTAEYRLRCAYTTLCRGLINRSWALRSRSQRGKVHRERAEKILQPIGLGPHAWLQGGTPKLQNTRRGTPTVVQTLSCRERPAEASHLPCVQGGVQLPKTKTSRQDKLHTTAWVLSYWRYAMGLSNSPTSACVRKLLAGPVWVIHHHLGSNLDWKA